ncbi:unnamed protein product [Caenorhabditis angaria]|uniref:ShKT domain-containing protein n=1 Tax=Caenorhabditis angaria TaxID=860376 RepID=A0A9P1IME7_9PELO|nr:unnamed protein product [Caenorhabditis angaria]
MLDRSKIVIYFYFLKIISTCVDQSPYCNENDCKVRPGYSMVYCKKTCGDCVEFCEDSKYINCDVERRKDCDDMLTDYCPKLCGKCQNRPKRTKTIPVTQTLTRKIARKPAQKMLPNGTFISPPLPNYQQFSENQNHQNNEKENAAKKIDEALFMHFEDFLPQPQRIWPEPEPMRIQPINVFQSHSSYQPVFQYSYSIPLGHPNEIKFNSLDHNPLVEPYLSPSFEKPSTTSTTSTTTTTTLPPFTTQSPKMMAKLITLLGCKNRDEIVCSQITAETCVSRPGYYLKLCPVTCKNCSGLQCIDSIKIDCEEVKSQGACKLSVAHEYCPRTCEYCQPPNDLIDTMSVCKDELDTCEELAKSGACEQDFSKSALRLYCAKSCGFCKSPQYYFSDSPLLSTLVSMKKMNFKTKKHFLPG